MRTFLRPNTVPLYRSIDGNGHQTPSEAYPFQGLDLATEPSPLDWRYMAKTAADICYMFRSGAQFSIMGEWKYAGKFTPTGTSIAELTRTGGDMLVSPCGLCQRPLPQCRCSFPRREDAQSDV